MYDEGEVHKNGNDFSFLNFSSFFTIYILNNYTQKNMDVFSRYFMNERKKYT